jgi:uncharacterized protein (TIGR02001 family)
MVTTAQPNLAISRKDGVKHCIQYGRHNLFAVVMAGAFCAFGPAFAEELEDAPAFDVSFGAALTSNYVARGISQSDGDPALQGYVEFDYDLLYASVWASNVNFAGTVGSELDFSFGLRPTLDAVSFDLGYIHYAFPGTEALSFGELFVGAEISPTEPLTLGAGLYFAPDYGQLGGSATYAEVSAQADLGNGFALDGTIGAQAFDEALGLASYVTWSAGASYSWNDTATIGLHYVDSTLTADACAGLMSSTACGARFLGTLSVDTALSSLRDLLR